MPGTNALAYLVQLSVTKKKFFITLTHESEPTFQIILNASTETISFKKSFLIQFLKGCVIDQWTVLFT